jgi:hypothetical protein
LCDSRGVNERVFESSDRNPRQGAQYRFGKRAVLVAEEKAHHWGAQGDDEGYAVWLRVAAVAGMLPDLRNPSVDEMH